MDPQHEKSDRPRVAIVGGRGQLGMELGRLLGSAGVALDLPEIDLTDAASVTEALDRLACGTVINCAAMTHVDRCQEEPDAAFAINAIGALHVAKASRAIGAALVYVSTDYVFGGDRQRRRPYDEKDRPIPINVYGCSKLAGEFFSLHENPTCVVVRTAGLYGRDGARGKGGNFVETMLRFAEQDHPVRVVDDQCLSPTGTWELAPRILALAGVAPPGIYHVTASDHCTWYAFATAIFELVGSKARPEPITSAAYGAPADRPHFSALISKRLDDVDIPMCPTWYTMLKEYLACRFHLQTADTTS
jgi:dTDP-4-dehydrorhamnose reductase